MGIRSCIIIWDSFFRIHDKSFIALTLAIYQKKKFQNVEYAKFCIILIFQIFYLLIYLRTLVDFSGIDIEKILLPVPCFNKILPLFILSYFY